MRAAVVTVLAVAVVTVAGCSPRTVTGAASTGSAATSTATPTESAAPTTDATYVAAPSADDNGLVAAQHSQCNEGSQILRYLASGDNRGDPSLDQNFASYVGTSKPQARALADQWIQACDQQYDRQAAAASSSRAQAEADASYSASAAASRAAASASQAAIRAVEQRSCAAIGGEVDDNMGQCHSTVQGNPSGKPGAECDVAWAEFNSDGTIWQGGLDVEHENYPDCFK